MDQRLIRILGGSTESYPYALESKYPRILETIMSLWDEDSIDDYFMELMVSSRGDRAGFPPDVAAEIMHLNLVHAAQEPPDKPKDIWDVTAESFVNFTTHATPGNSGSDTNADIRNQLAKLGVPCTPDGFFDAVEEGNRSAVALLTEVPISTEIRDSRGWTPLMMAAFRGRHEILSLLIERKADVNALDLGGNTALHWAAFSGHTGCTKKLIQHHARTDVRNNFGWTPLMQATARDHLEVAAILISSGVNLDTSADDGYTPLHKAAASGYVDLVRLLLEQGANKKLRTNEGHTPLQLAVKNKNELVIEALSL